MAPTRTLPSHPRPIDSFPGRAPHASWLASACCFALALLPLAAAHGEPIHRITIDGNFSDWDSVTPHFDPLGTYYHPGTTIPDVHDTDHDKADDIPTLVQHPDVDIREYKFTHDENNLYAYFRATGEIGRTQTAAQGKAGRYYVIVTIDVDNDDSTGYLLHEGGYYPTSAVDLYDANFEVEFYDGGLNTAHYLSHDALNTGELNQDFVNLTDGEYPENQPGPYAPGFVQPAAGNYDNYTQWVYHNDDTLTLVYDKDPAYPDSIMDVWVSEDGHEIEIRAPYKGFLNDESDEPNMALGKTIDISFSLEASGELWEGVIPFGGDWASDTAEPIEGYFLGVPEPVALLLAGLASIALATTTGRRRR